MLAACSGKGSPTSDLPTVTPPTPATLTILTQKGGSAEIIDGSCTLQSVADAPIENELLLLNDPSRSSYAGGQVHTYSCDQDVGLTDVRAHGRLGGSVCKTGDLMGLSLTWDLTTSEGVIGGQGITSEAVPADVDCVGQLLEYKLPVICPWMASARLLSGEDASIDPAVISTPANDWEDLSLDPRNNPPSEVVVNGTPDVFDCANVLRIDKVDTRFEWESRDLLIGYAGDTPMYEGVGGVYSNFHYSVMPWDAQFDTQYQAFLAGLGATDADYATPGGAAVRASELMYCFYNPAACLADQTNAYHSWQFLLHLGMGSLAEIGQGALEPKLQLSSLVPGAFWSKKEGGNDQCEWLDMTLLATSGRTRQAVTYRNFGIWDWDAQASDPNPCVAVLIWEGDGNQTPIARSSGVIGPTDIADDFVGYFKVCRNQMTSAASLTLENFSKDLLLTLSTGDTQCR
jgi:hypothetical protein